MAEGVDATLIEFLRSKKFTSSARLADYCETRAEVRELLVDGCPETRGGGSKYALLIGVWRAAESKAQEKRKRRAASWKDEEILAPLDLALEQNLVQGVAQSYGFGLSEHELIWPHMLGRLRREVDRSSHSLIHMRRVGNQRESGRSEAARKLRLGDSV